MTDSLQTRIAKVRVETWDQNIGADGAAAILRDIPELLTLSAKPVSLTAEKMRQQCADIIQSAIEACKERGHYGASINGLEAVKRLILEIPTTPTPGPQADENAGIPMGDE